MTNNNDNLNFHSHGKSVFDEKLEDKNFAEYRRAWSENFKKSIISPAPLHVDIESTNACNLKCPGCARTSGGWGMNDTGFMDYELFKSIIDQISESGVYSAKLSLRGEPLLHPKILDMVNYVSKSNLLDFYFNTNGVLLDENMITGLIDNGLPRLSISVDGWSEESFNRSRTGADFNLVCSNIEKIILLKKKLKSEIPKVRVQAVLFDDFIEHKEDYSELWYEKVDEVGFLDARKEGKGINHCGIINESFCCPFLWQRMTILYDGTLLPCLMHGVDDIHDMVLGNVASESIKKQWNSDFVNNLRTKHIAGKTHEIRACDNCSYRACIIKKYNI